MHYHPLDRLEWVCDQVLDVLHHYRGPDGVSEGKIFEEVVKGRTENKPWMRFSGGARAIAVHDAIEVLIRRKRIRAIAGKTQATGRRFFEVVNILDAIVENL